MSKTHQFFSRYGPGGRLCNCCGPAPRQRKKFDRMVKRRARAAANQELKKMLEEE